MDEIKKTIGVLECMAIDLTGGLAGLSGKNPMADVLQQRIAAINTAQSALQEKLDREKGCEHCAKPSCSTCATSRGSTECLHCDRRDAYTPHKFCKYCGRALIKTKENGPLTIEELRQMVGQVVWLHNVEPHDQWARINGVDSLVVRVSYFGDGEEYAIRCAKCGVTWDAYRRKPEAT